MFKANFGICSKCNQPKLIVVKKGLCSFCNESNKKENKRKGVENIFKQVSDSVPKLVKKLDNIFSIYIRLKDADKNGLVKCYTCGKIDLWKKQQCGHFISRRHKTLRWYVLNAKPQCFGCNIKNQGAGNAFAHHLKEDYGEQILTLLEIKKNNRCLIGRFEIQLLISEFTKKVEEIKLSHLQDSHFN